MIVIFQCPTCDTEVTSNMDRCPQCGIELPEMTLERDYDAEIDEELDAIAHPIQARIKKFIHSYGDHLKHVIEQDVAVENAVTQKIAEIRHTNGNMSARWFKIKQHLVVVLAALGIVGCVVLFGMYADTVRSERTAYITWAILSLIPLYAVSLGLLVRADTRNKPLHKKILENALGAFNKMIFSIVYIGLILFVVISLNKFLFAY